MAITSDLPWLETDDALGALDDALRDGRLTADAHQKLWHWRTHGYCLLPGAIPHQAIDSLQADLDAVWTATTPIPDLTIEQLRFGADGPGVTHARLLELSSAERDRLRTTQAWRIHGFEAHSTGAQAILDHPTPLYFVRTILAQEVELINTICFMYGSQQLPHQDVAVTHVWPYRFLIGVWVACEDINPESGPLLFYPKSHREALFTGFADYPRTNLRTAGPATLAGYQAHVDRLAEAYPKELLIGKKGDVLLWHGMLLHGGAPILDRHKTRRSFVYHYTIRGGDKSAEIEGPFNW